MCIVCQVVRLYSVMEIIVISGEMACCSVVCGTLVGVSVFSIMWLLLCEVWKVRSVMKCLSNWDLNLSTEQ